MKNKTVSINIFIVLLAVAQFCNMAANGMENDIIRWASYGFEIILIFFCFLQVIKSRNVRLWEPSVLFVVVILVLNYLFSPNEPHYTDLIKFLGYYFCFKYGCVLAQNNKPLKASNFSLYLLIFVPLVVGAVFDRSEGMETFFANTNNFVFIGLSMGLLYALVKCCDNTMSSKYHIAWVIVGLFVLTGTSLGVIVAIFFAFFILNFSFSRLFYVVIGFALAILIIFTVDLPVFIRFRDVFAVWGEIDKYDLMNIQDVNIHEITSRAERLGNRTDTGSSVWRLMHWTKLFLAYITSITHIPFGLGAGYATKVTELPPHNDYLLILTEYGLVVFYLFISFLRKVFRGIKDKRIMYFVAAMVCYYFTENLIHSFPPNAILYFAIGYYMYKSIKPIYNDIPSYESVINQ